MKRPGSLERDDERGVRRVRGAMSRSVSLSLNLGISGRAGPTRHKSVLILADRAISLPGFRARGYVGRGTDPREAYEGDEKNTERFHMQISLNKDA